MHSRQAQLVLQTVERQPRPPQVPAPIRQHRSTRAATQRQAPMGRPMRPEPRAHNNPHPPPPPAPSKPRGCVVLEIMPDRPADGPEHTGIPRQAPPRSQPACVRAMPALGPALPVALLARWTTCSLQSWRIPSGGRYPCSCPPPPPALRTTHWTLKGTFLIPPCLCTHTPRDNGYFPRT